MGLADQHGIPSPPPAWCITPGGLIEAAIVVCLVGFWLLCGPDARERGVFDLAVPVSLSGVYVAARRLLSSASPPSFGIGLWGAHGLVGLMSVGIFMGADTTAGDTAAGSDPEKVLVYCFAALIAQLLMGLVAARRLIRRQSSGFSDVVGSGVCASYGLVMGGWALLIVR